MKIKDYWRLAKISLQARKKSTKATVRGMAFSLIIIVPLLFMMIGLNQSILDKLNKEPDQLYATFYSAEAGNKIIEEAKPYQEGTPSWHIDDNNSGVAYADHSNYFDNSDIKTLHYSTHEKDINSINVPNGNGKTRRIMEKLIVDGTSHDLVYTMPDSNKGMSRSDGKILMSVIKDDITKTNEMLDKYLVADMNGGFRDNGAEQVILGEKYLKYAGLTAADVYGKKVSVYFRDSCNGTIFVSGETPPPGAPPAEDRQLNSISHHLFKDFEVVGVIKDGQFSRYDIRNSGMIFTSASYYGPNGKPLLAPNRVEIQEMDFKQMGYHYGDHMAKERLSDKYVYPGGTMYGYGSVAYKYTPGEDMNRDNREETIVENNVYLYLAKDYKDLDKTIKEVAPIYDKIYAGDTGSLNYNMASEVYVNFAMINTIFSYAMLFGGIVAGVILFAALINLFNSIKHSVDSRRNYLGVMKAIGARDATIPKLYFFEVLRIFLRAYVRIFIVGTIICVGIMVALFYATKDTAFKFVISWTNIPIVMGILAALLVVMGVLYSLVCSYSMSKRPITELLEE